MAVGPGIYKAKYENCSLDELEKELRALEKFLLSDELKEMRQEEIDMGVDDNDCIANVETEIDVLKELIANKKTNDNNTDVERCMCGNELVVNWSNDEKFKMVRCLNCNAEMKFRNPNFIEEKLDDVINKVVSGDPFWETTIKKYFDGLTTKNDSDKIKFLKKLVLNKDLFNEFTKEILNSDDAERLFNKYNTKSTVCPNCGATLTFFMPDGKTLHCDKCNKYYLNNNGNVGDETSSPYTRNDVLY